MSEPATTLDWFLGGRLAIEQPAKGRHRAGLDAILLAAAVPRGFSGQVVDLGAGVGTAGLALARRVTGARVTLIERDREAAALAALNAARSENGDLAARARVIEADILAKPDLRETAGFHRGAADLAIMNPPFFPARSVRASPSDPRRAAHVLEAAGLEPWIRAAAWATGPKGRLALIFRGDAIGEILSAIGGRFGGVSIIPVHPRDGQAAHRLIVTAVKASRAAPRILPGLILHPEGSSLYSPEAEAILNGARGLFDEEADVEQRPGRVVSTLVKA